MTTSADGAVGHAKPRTTVVHDYFTQSGGAERVAIVLARRFGTARIATSAVIPERTFPEVGELSVRTYVPRLPAAVIRRRGALGPLAGLAFLAHSIDDGVVVCSSSGWSHWIRGRAPRLVYCHTPARWLYETDDYFGRLPKVLRAAVRTCLAPLRLVDRRRMATAARIVANGPVTAQRIRRVYDLDAEIVAPPPGLDPGGPWQRPDGVRPDFFLVVARPRGYKNLSLVRSVFENRLGEQLAVVGGTGDGQAHGGNVVDLGRVPDAELRWLYAHARAVMCLAHEDLGLVPLEAFQFGTPVVALRAGGYLATCVEGVNAVFVDEADGASIIAALDSFSRTTFDRRAIRETARAFGVDGFAASIGRLIAELATGMDRADGGSRNVALQGPHVGSRTGTAPRRDAS